MEIALIGALTYAGHLLNLKKNKEPEQKYEVSNNLKANGNNMYDSGSIKKAINKEKLIAKKSFQKSKDVKNTNIVPTSYNKNTIERQELQRLKDNERNYKNYLDSLSKYFESSSDTASLKDLQKEYIQEHYQKVNNANNRLDLSLFNNKNTKLLDLERDILLSNDIDQVFNEDNLVSNGEHNNMVPFFGSHITQNLNENEYTKNKLETFTGVSKHWKKKEEIINDGRYIKDNYSYVNGAPIINLDYNRFNESREKRNELPFKYKQVGPGLNKGYNTEGTIGMHDTYRADSKTVDELRTKSNPKNQYCGVVLSGEKINKRQANPNIKKRRPKTYYENGRDRYFTTTGSVIAPTMHGNIMEKAKKHQVIEPYTGSSNPNSYQNPNKPENMYAKSRIPHRTSNKMMDPTNPSSDVKKYNNTKNSHYAKKTHRQDTSEKVQNANVQGHGKRTVYDDEDRPAPTHKESTMYNTEKFSNIGGNRKGKVYYTDKARKTNKETLHKQSDNLNVISHNKQMVYDPTDITKITNRQTLQQGSEITNLAGNNKLIAYDSNDLANITNRQTLHQEYESRNVDRLNKSIVYDYNDITRTTNRQTLHPESDKLNVNSYNKSTAYDETDHTRTTNRQTLHPESDKLNINAYNKSTAYDETDHTRTTNRQTLHNEYDNRNINSHRKSVAYDETDHTRRTIRETTGDHEHYSNLLSNTKHITYDPCDITRTTNRQTLHNESDNLNIKLYQKNIVYDQNDIARTTTKETTIHTDRDGNIGNRRKHITYDPDDVTRTTIRETTDYTQRDGNIGNRRKHIVYDPNDATRTTTKETTIDNIRDGNIGNRRKHITYDPDDKAKTTLREGLSDKTREGNLLGDVKQVVYDPDDLPNTTLRELLADKTREGHVKHYNKSITYNPEDIAKPTQKEELSNNSHTGIANKNSGHQSYTGKYNAITNQNREEIAVGRKPTNSNTKVSIGSDMIDMDTHRQSYDQCRENQPTQVYHKLERLPCVEYNENIPSGEDNNRLDPNLYQAYRQNPYTIRKI